MSISMIAWYILFHRPICQCCHRKSTCSCTAADSTCTALDMTQLRENFGTPEGQCLSVHNRQKPWKYNTNFRAFLNHITKNHIHWFLFVCFLFLFGRFSFCIKKTNKKLYCATVQLFFHIVLFTWLLWILLFTWILWILHWIRIFTLFNAVSVSLHHY